jgi:hypothetical protein
MLFAYRQLVNHSTVQAMDLHHTKAIWQQILILIMLTKQPV